jgi:hypothetical protein
MNAWALAVFWLLLGMAAIHAIAAVPFIWRLHHWRRPRLEDACCPKTAVILCLRGSDPFLAACLQGVLDQDYPCYDVRIVVDSPHDPAWKTVQEVLARSGATNVQVRPLADRRPTCSLKCSCILQAVSELDATHEIMALIDADVVPHRTWLRELVAPLQDGRVAAATGNRWYMPVSPSWGSLVRWLWNAAAVVHMDWYRIPWGGTLAVKVEALRKAHLTARWDHALCEDTLLYGAFRPLGYRVARVPSLMMVNREQCSVATFYPWVCRQLLTIRLHHPAWRLLAVHDLATSFALWSGPLALIVAMAIGDGAAARWLLAGMGLQWGVLIVILMGMEVGMRRMMAARGEPTVWFGLCGLARTVPAMVLTLAIYPAALLCALRVRETSWRGIGYQVEGPGQIRMKEYRPYSECPASERRPESL